MFLSGRDGIYDLRFNDEVRNDARFQLAAGRSAAPSRSFSPSGDRRLKHP